MLEPRDTVMAAGGCAVFTSLPRPNGGVESIAQITHFLHANCTVMAQAITPS